MTTKCFIYEQIFCYLALTWFVLFGELEVRQITICGASYFSGRNSWNLIAVKLILHERRIWCLELVILWSRSWWRLQMDALSVLPAFCDGNPPVTGGFALQRAVTRSFDVFFDLRLSKHLNKQSRCCWFDTPWRLLCNFVQYIEG